ncbi:ubiquitin-like protein [Pleomassaria siparia CBS 279.74]|uniref:Ubiquitin-like protein n=1 Tax=Pleomassaria siparia CBS 279.74 TaxID=1314801 RepID=A0A6G1JW33_9PLEO|nr:ubiquitin-like protein [Pleomassaria siparia CBS 279.74]
MATLPSDQPSTGIPNAPQITGSQPPSSGTGASPASPVELRTLTAAAEPTNTTAHAPETTANLSSIENPTLQTQEQSTHVAPIPTAPSDPEPAKAETLSAPANLTRTDIEAIGPSTESPTINPDTTNGPVVVIMLLLTTGARHPYKIDEKYLKKRNITIDAMDPYNISVYTLKELIWRDWREEWETRPTSPSSIRLIHFGRMLDDKSPLKDCRFQTESPNVVHMTVKPQEVVDDEDARTGKMGGRNNGDEESHVGCRCIIL